MTTVVRGAARNPNPESTPNDGAPTDGESKPNAESPDDMRSRLDKEELLAKFIGWFKDSRDHYQEWRQEAAQCYDMVAGHQWEDDDIQVLVDQGRPAVTFNRIGPFVDGVSGLEIGNRQTTQFYPRTVGESGEDELLTAAGQWARDECDAEDEESESVRDVIITGVGVTQTRMSYDMEPDGLIKIDRVDPLEVYPDPASRKPNYSDGRFVLRVKDVPVSVAEDMFPDYSTVDLHAQWAEDQPDETRQPHNARIAPYYRIDQAGQIDRERQQCRLVEVEWWDYVPAWRVMDPSTGRFVRLDDKACDLYQARARALGIKTFVAKDRARRYYKAMVGNVVLKVMRGPDSGGFTYKFMTAKRDRNNGTWFGLVRAMIDPQMWANKLFTQALHIVNTNAKGGLLAETDAFVDIQEARDAWADSDSIIELNPGGMGKVQQKEPPAFPPQINLMMDSALAAIPATAGVNLEMIAQQTDQNPGVLEMQRKQQGMTVLAYIFDAKRRYQKEQGRLMIWMLQTFISDGRLIRIGGPEQAQYVPFIKNPGLAEYDVIVDDAPSSPNMKERTWAMIMQMFPMLKSLPPTALIKMLKYSPLPASMVTDIEQAAAQPPPPSPPPPPKPQSPGEQAVDQALAAKHAADTRKTDAETQKSMAELNGNLNEQAARIEKLRADAINALQDAGITADDARFQQMNDAVATLLNAQSAAHSQMMDIAGHSLDVHQALTPPPQPIQPPGANTASPQS